MFGCVHEKPCVLAPGTYTTAGKHAFLPGFSFTVPATWVSPYHSAGELALEKAGVPNGIYIGRDVVPVPGHRRLDTRTDLTAVGIARWIAGHPDLIVSEPEATTIGDGVPAVTIVVAVSPTAESDDPDCPTRACVDFVTDPVHADHPLGLPAGDRVRLYLADIGTTTAPRRLMVNVWSTGDSELARLVELARPIIDSIRLPAVIVDN